MCRAQVGFLPTSPLQEKPGLPLCRKLCYAVGGIPYQMTGNALGFFLQIFLLDVVQVSAAHGVVLHQGAQRKPSRLAQGWSSTKVSKAPGNALRNELFTPNHNFLMQTPPVGTREVSPGHFGA